ncbi:hypothetical protein K435DRAFT_939342 [Dendrothele bispora CBS 962.96]|uniref:Uncharacterized protein n=1 Tax=Dendrothele bispora (strain CBS 962.96) TaxID=1314807 RepID=A0A4S8KXP2_DENBC|nr:hypothetical protein K435DRAFT_939342 [Dendrothele bispora CBS 962.96]
MAPHFFSMVLRFTTTIALAGMTFLCSLTVYDKVQEARRDERIAALVLVETRKSRKLSIIVLTALLSYYAQLGYLNAAAWLAFLILLSSVIIAIFDRIDKKNFHTIRPSLFVLLHSVPGLSVSRREGKNMMDHDPQKKQVLPWKLEQEILVSSSKRDLVSFAVKFKWYYLLYLHIAIVLKKILKKSRFWVKFKGNACTWQFTWQSTTGKVVIRLILKLAILPTILTCNSASLSSETYALIMMNDSTLSFLRFPGGTRTGPLNYSSGFHASDAQVP